MSHKLLIATALVAAAVLGVAWFGMPSPLVYTPPSNSPATTQGQTQQPVATTTISTPTPPAPAPTSFTLAQVATHGNASSCWSAVNGKVYNLTSWINQHPGGSDTILSICGTDGSSAFNAQHSGQRRPANELAGFYIGTLIQ